MAADTGETSPRPSKFTVVGALFRAVSDVPYALLKLMGPISVTVLPVTLLKTVTLADVAVSVSVAVRPFCIAAERAAEKTAVSSCRDVRNALRALISDI